MSVRATLLAGFVGVFLPIGLLSLVVLATQAAADARTHELYQDRLVATVTLGQTVENLDQVRQMVMQYVLTAGSPASIREQQLTPTGAALAGGPVAIRKQERAIATQLAALDVAIARTLDRYGQSATARRQQALLRRWPAVWQAFRSTRAVLLRQSAEAMTVRRPVLHLLTVTLNDRLNAALDLVYALMGAEQRQGYAVDQQQQDASRRTLIVLAGGMGLVALISVALAAWLTRAVSRLYEDATSRAVQDGLTGLLNHRTFLERLDAALRDPETPWALLFFDVDNFKLFNDCHGHPAGDSVLRAVAGVLRASCRAGDVLARYGGDEFAALLRGATAAEVGAVAQRLEAVAWERPFQTPNGTLIPLRLSVGSACYPTDGRTRAELIAVADAAMYAAKGRRRTAAADLLGDSPVGILEGLVAAVDAKDCYTREHSEDVTRWALLLAAALDVPRAQRQALAYAGPLHDWTRPHDTRTLWEDISSPRA